jgi:hypothetical protein
MLVPLFDLKFLLEFAAGDAGTSNRRHQCPDSEVRIIARRPLLRTSESEGHSQLIDSGAGLGSEVRMMNLRPQ